MVWWIANIQKNEVSDDYSYVIVGSEDKVYFQSTRYDTIYSCKEAIYSLRKSIRKYQDRYIQIVERNEKYYYDVKAANYVSFGKSTVFYSENECREALKQFVEFMQKTGSILYNKNEMNIGELPVDPRIMDYMFSLDGMGFDENGNAISENPTKVKQWEHPDSVFWSNHVIREKYLNVVLKLEGTNEK